jgi:hypothetical protein
MLEKADTTPPPKVRAEKNEAGEIVARVETSDSSTMGSADRDFANNLSTQLAVACRAGADDPEEFANNMNPLLAAMHGIRPRDEIEGMLAAQMIAAHTAAMKMLQRMYHAEYLEHADAYSNRANKFMRTYVAQMDALKRYRAVAQQTVRVERVYVNEGGQAIVGNVNHGGPGAPSKTEHQPHAVTYAPGQTMPSQDPAGNVVPIASDEERAVQTARR